MIAASKDAPQHVSAILSRLQGVRQTGAGWSARCPAHDDGTASLSVSVGENGSAVLCCHAGCQTAAVVRAIGLKMKSLFAPSDDKKPRGKGTFETAYDYQNEVGELLSQVVRFKDPKDFRQRRPDGNGGWVWSMKGVRRILYRLPWLIRAPTGAVVFLPEGEKDCDNIRERLGLTATTSACGADNWLDEYAEHLKGRLVCILVDNDDPGRRRGQVIARSIHGKAAGVRIVEPPGVPPGGDISDWISAGGTKEQLLALANAALDWDPSSAIADGDGRCANRVARGAGCQGHRDSGSAC